MVTAPGCRLGLDGAVAAVAALLLFPVASWSAPAAPSAGSERAAVVRALSDCRKITDDASRLACYDKAAGALDQAESQGQVVVIDAAQANTVRRQAFGFKLPSLSIFTRSQPPTGEGVDHLSMTLDDAHRGGDGRYTFVASDGAVWRQTDDGEFAIDPQKGSALLVKRGALGSFFCKVDKQPQVRCARVN